MGRKQRKQGKVNTLPQNKGNRRVNEMQDSEYNHDVDAALEAIEAILEEMIIESKEQWYRSVMFQHWIEDSNYSAISKRLNIPRTSVARAVKEARIHIQTTLKNRIKAIKKFLKVKHICTVLRTQQKNNILAQNFYLYCLIYILIDV